MYTVVLLNHLVTSGTHLGVLTLWMLIHADNLGSPERAKSTLPELPTFSPRTQSMFGTAPRLSGGSSPMTPASVRYR